ncbi:DUF397 domain-containing protein [Nocardiopsis dassonvillei]|uniref:DUF397 domain-containing protein n=1 Tax=Nocardiopsis dassonvillei TaxID=2014 RepID=UPI000B9D5D22|nr:DUF397 domain-containing protein [Nocardiopsis dassonvillei]ASU57714.1 DUF397 domain-containing protein [Nocardiopsis dassonvillei]
MSEWFKSSYSENAAHCVELRHRRGRVQVRDTQNQEAATLAFPAAEWAALLRCEGPASAR